MQYDGGWVAMVKAISSVRGDAQHECGPASHQHRRDQERAHGLASQGENCETDTRDANHYLSLQRQTYLHVCHFGWHEFDTERLYHPKYECYCQRDNCDTLKYQLHHSPFRAAGEAADSGSNASNSLMCGASTISFAAMDEIGRPSLIAKTRRTCATSSDSRT
jgi:hypothetical protein